MLLSDRGVIDSWSARHAKWAAGQPERRDQTRPAVGPALEWSRQDHQHRLVLAHSAGEARWLVDLCQPTLGQIVAAAIRLGEPSAGLIVSKLQRLNVVRLARRHTPRSLRVD